MPPAKEGPDTALPPDGHCVGSCTDSSGGRVGWGSAGPGRQKGGARPGLSRDQILLPTEEGALWAGQRGQSVKSFLPFSEDRPAEPPPAWLSEGDWCQ